MEDWQKQMVDLQQIFVEYNKELEKKQKELTDPVFERVLGIIKRLASRDGYDAGALDKQTVAYDPERPGPHRPVHPALQQRWRLGPRPPDKEVARVRPVRMVVRLRAPASVRRLAGRIGGEVWLESPESGDAAFAGVVPLDIAGEGELAPLLAPRYLKAAEAALDRGAVVLADALHSRRGLRALKGRLWTHAQAGWALALVLGECERVELAASCGEGTSLGANVVLEARVVVGRRVTIGAGAVIGAPGFGWATGPRGQVLRVPQLGGVVIEDDVSIGPLCTIDAGTLSPTRIRRGAKLDAQVHVGHNVDIGEGTIVAAQSGFAGSVRVGRGVLVGGQVGVADHVKIGDGARIAAKSGVIGDIPAGATVAGYPAVSRAKWLRALAHAYRRLS